MTLMNLHNLIPKPSEQFVGVLIKIQKGRVLRFEQTFVSPRNINNVRFNDITHVLNLK